MEILEDLAFRKTLLDKIEKREFSDRSGTHSSDLIYCLNKSALRKLTPRPSTEEEILLFSIGWSTQRWLTGQDKETEFEVDGIKVTPDAQNERGCPWELKATYQSSNKDVSENIHWLRQIMSQCKVTGTTSAKLSRFEIMGDWKWVFGKGKEKAQSTRPTLHAYHIEFSPQEIENNWTWMKQRRDLYLAIMKSRVLLPKAMALPPGEDYECERCPYTRECAGGHIEVSTG